MKSNNRFIVFLAVIFSFVFLLCACSDPLGEKEYMEDIYINIPDSRDKILIKEWRYLLGSGEDVYFVSSGTGEKQLLGRLTGGDDGYCPFADGKYKVSFAAGEVEFFWSFNGGEEYTKSKSFVLPK
ncbi:MAG: hypothetical protein IJX74_00420 [Clostridia bacterium]|nr:hypothetical protein [Clostridia bacterium]